VIYGFNDAQTARELAAIRGSRPPQSRSADPVYGKFEQWLVLVPGSGIPAVSGTTAGFADCKVHELVNGTLVDTDITVTVYNVGAVDIPANTYQPCWHVNGVPVIVSGSGMSEEEIRGLVCDAMCECDNATSAGDCAECCPDVGCEWTDDAIRDLRIFDAGNPGVIIWEQYQLSYRDPEVTPLPSECYHLIPIRHVDGVTYGLAQMYNMREVDIIEPATTGRWTGTTPNTCNGAGLQMTDPGQTGVNGDTLTYNGDGQQCPGCCESVAGVPCFFGGQAITGLAVTTPGGTWAQDGPSYFPTIGEFCVWEVPVRFDTFTNTATVTRGAGANHWQVQVDAVIWHTTTDNSCAGNITLTGDPGNSGSMTVATEIAGAGECPAALGTFFFNSNRELFSGCRGCGDSVVAVLNRRWTDKTLEAAAGTIASKNDGLEKTDVMARLVEARTEWLRTT
jgi:hypothetical protein